MFFFFSLFLFHFIYLELEKYCGLNNQSINQSFFFWERKDILVFVCIDGGLVLGLEIELDLDRLVSIDS
jgi:hypothetical protein